MTRRALITGITGQDGSYLAELLLAEGYEVHGVTRQAITHEFELIEHLRPRLHLHEADLLDQFSLVSTLQEVQPEEVYNLAAQSFVPQSWSQPILTSESTGLGVTRMLEAIRRVDPSIRFYQAGSSDMFGQVDCEPQNEQTPFRPRSPYGAAKVYGYWMTANYRDRYDLFACSGILFNHESPHRPKDFVSRKITSAAARIKLGLQKELHLGNLQGQRDWGFAGDYVRSMWLMLQQDLPHDYVIASGTTHTVRDWVEMAFEQVDLDWREYVQVDEDLFRADEMYHLRGDSSKASRELGWEPSTTFEQLVSMMVEADLRRAQNDLAQIDRAT